MRMYRIKRKLYSFHTEFSGDTINLPGGIVLKKTEPVGFMKWISSFSRYVRENLESTIWYDAYKGQDRIGEMQIDAVPGTKDLHLGWIGIDPGYRRNGYATEVLRYFIHEARRKGFSRIILEATEMGYPVYKGLGFREIPVEKEKPSLFRRFFEWSWGNPGELEEKLVKMELVL